MDELLNFLLVNREWVFSGAGVVVFTGLFQLFSWLKGRKAKIGSEPEEQKSIVNTITIEKGESLTSDHVKQIAQNVFAENFPKLQVDAQEEALRRKELFMQELDKQISEKLQEHDLNSFRKPDVQYALNTALITSARRGEPETIQILSSLLINRILSDEKELKDIVYAEAINVMGKLTKEQLKIIAICFAIEYYRGDGIDSWEKLLQILRMIFVSLGDISAQAADYLHLEYTGCVKDTGFGASIEYCLLENHPKVFRKNEKYFFEKDDYKIKKINDDLRKQLFVFLPELDGYNFKEMSRPELLEIIEKK